MTASLSPTLHIEGTRTGRISSRDKHRSSTPKSGQFATNADGQVYSPDGVCGLHMGPRTKQSNPYTYDPLLVYATGATPDGSAYSDRLLQWRPYPEVRAFMRQHFGNEGDYYDNRSPQAIEAFLRDTLNLPQLQLVRIEEHCCQSSGFPVWYFGFIRGDAAQASSPAAPA